jgi:hypothetical protein
MVAKLKFERKSYYQKNENLGKIRNKYIRKYNLNNI